MTLDIEAIRGDFPILERRLPNGNQLVYFDNAATSQSKHRESLQYPMKWALMRQQQCP